MVKPGNNSNTDGNTNSNEASSSNSNIELDLKLIVQLIPEFNGSFENLLAFIDGVTEANNLASESQKIILFSFIKSKIIGSAKSIIQSSNFSSWESLKKKLIEIYGEKKSFVQVQIELQNTKQYRNENVASFTQRIENKVHKLMTTLTFESGEKIDKSQQDLIKKMGLTAFIHNCLPEYGQLLRIRSPETISEASKLANNEEVALKFQRMNLQSNNNRQNPNFKRVNTTTQICKSFCSYCKRDGHSFDNCFKRKNQEKVCSYCKKKGHVFEKCFLRQNGSQVSENKVVSKNENYSKNSIVPRNEYVSKNGVGPRNGAISKMKEEMSPNAGQQLNQINTLGNFSL